MLSEETKDKRLLMEVRGLKKYYPVGSGLLKLKKQNVKAVDDISFKIYEGEVLGVVGESGCGKSTIGMSILRLEEPTAGDVLLENESILKLGSHKLQQARKKMQLVFQDPFASLNPRKTIRQTIIEPLDIFEWKTRAERHQRTIQIADEVGINKQYLDRLPHEFSGGQRQRICIARALVINPKFIVADEPVSALDVSIQAQVINLLLRLKREYKLTYLFISHDMRVVKHICNRVAVMYLGKIVEIADKKSIFAKPLHPYTQALLSAVPRIRKQAKKQKIILQGDVGSPLNIPQGCRFHPRCPMAESICKTEEPELRQWGEGERKVACHLA